MPNKTNSSRLDKIADMLQRELALLIQSELRDPRLGMVSVTGARVSKDLSYADIYVTMLGAETQAEQTEGLAVLNRAGGFLRSHLAKVINLRTTPKLRFHYDESISRGQHLSSLIDQALAADRQKHADDEQGGA